MIFFFQAEDGIRDGHVTGVQTCALPISAVPLLTRYGFLPRSIPRSAHLEARRAAFGQLGHSVVLCFRSEERRVGKECGCRLWPCHDRKKERLDCVVVTKI